MRITITAVDAMGEESVPSEPYLLIPPEMDSTGNYLPLAVIQTNIVSGAAPLPVGFDGSKSSDAGGVVTRFDWAFGDGGVGGGRIADYTYMIPATYVAALTVTDDGGASGSATTTIGVNAPTPVNLPPVAAFTAAIIQLENATVGFDASTANDPDGNIVTYGWDFGDGGIAAGPVVSHRFLAVGDYTVVLTVTDNLGQSGQDRMIITIADQPAPENITPVAAISTRVSGQLLHFTWSYEASGQDLAGFRLYQNGNLVCQIADPLARQADCQVYLDYGQVEFYLAAYDRSGLEGRVSERFSFSSVGMVPLVTAGELPLRIHCSSGTSFDPDGVIVSYSWNFGDGSVSQEAVTSHTFSVPGNYTIVLTVTDNLGAKAQGKTLISVTKPKNLPPRALDLAAVTNRNITASGFLEAEDPERAPLQFRIVGNGNKGIATLVDPVSGAFRYVPIHNATGPDLFTFKANDGELDSSLATVSMVIKQTNSIPEASALAFTVSEDSAFAGVLNATDADQDSLTYSLLTTGALGRAELANTQTGAFIYTPKARVYGSDSFTYIANDGFVDSAPATVTVTIAKVNHPPLAFDDPAITERNSPVTIAVTANDSDPDADPLSLTSLTPPRNGTATILDGMIRYTPNPGFTGVDSFSYTVSDGEMTAAGKVVVTVTPPRLLLSISWSFDPGGANIVGFRLYYNGVLACATADPAARNLSCQVTQQAGPQTFALSVVDATNSESILSNKIIY